MAKRILRAERLRGLLYYDPTSKSALRWKSDRVTQGFGDIRAGDEAGTVLLPRPRQRKTPCWLIQAGGISLVGHNAVWEILNGTIPKGNLVGHKDGNALNNKIENLFLAKRPCRGMGVDSEEFADVFEYDPNSPSGLRWKVDWTGRAVKGSRAGAKGKLTHKGIKSWDVRINGKAFGAHRIIWQLERGPIPDGVQIDHIDGNPLNNRLENLRLATPAINSRNKSMRSDNKTGVVGVSLEVGAGIYRAQYVDLEGRQRSKKFSINKYGQDEALRLATQWRADRIAEINAEGAGYTERHIGEAVGEMI